MGDEQCQRHLPLQAIGDLPPPFPSLLILPVLHQNKPTEKTPILLKAQENLILIDNGKTEKISFLFDHILLPSATQEEVYQHVLPLIQDTIRGYNGTILTYGQTGSGN